MLHGGWNCDTKWRLYMQHLRAIDEVYKTRTDVEACFAPDGPHGDLMFLHQMLVNSTTRSGPRAFAA